MKIAIVTINDNNNYGNRLQNYATQEMLKKMYRSVQEVYTIKNSSIINRKTNLFEYFLRIFKFLYRYVLMNLIIKLHGLKKHLIG